MKIGTSKLKQQLLHPLLSSFLQKEKRIVLMRKKILEEPFAIQLGIALFVGGALGNLIDRIQTGLVVDFFDFRIWPVFNMADIAICMGVGVMIWSIICEEMMKKK